MTQKGGPVATKLKVSRKPLGTGLIRGKEHREQDVVAQVVGENRQFQDETLLMVSRVE